MTHHIVFYDWQKAKPFIKKIRFSVFVQEQKIPESEEWDEHDKSCLHGVLFQNQQAVGCVRLSPDGKIGRLAVLLPFRKKGFGRALMLAALEKAAEQGVKLVQLSAQVYLVNFYQSMGFNSVCVSHWEVGIEHQWMQYKFD